MRIILIVITISLIVMNISLIIIMIIIIIITTSIITPYEEFTRISRPGPLPVSHPVAVSMPHPSCDFIAL